MTYKGVARGRIVELTESLPFQDGEQVTVSIEPAAAQIDRGSPAAIIHAMCQPPHLDSMDVDAMDREIERGRLPVQSEGLFDACQ